MKPILLLITCLCSTLLLQAQVSKTVSLTAGSLKTRLTTDELTTVSNLTITGILDARDFKNMRDKMPRLAVLDMSNAMIAAYKGTEGPSDNITDYDADAIPAYAFYIGYPGEISLQSILIPLSTKVIGRGAFNKCYRLTSFYIPSSVTAIHENAFNFCSGLTSISIPPSVTTIGKNAFYLCVRLKSVNIPSSVDSIQSTTFYACDSLVSVDIPSSVTYIGDKAFAGCLGMVSLTLSPTITTIGKGAFSSCISLSGEVMLPKGLKAIRESTFSDCSSLHSVIIPASVDSIGSGAFSGCRDLSTLTLPSALACIGDFAFSGCSLLTGTVSLPITLTTIGRNAFENCSGLTSLTIPSSVNSIGQEAFFNCISLTSIEVNQLFPLSLQAAPSVFHGIDRTTTTLHVPFGTKERYANAYGWKDFTTVIEGAKGFLLNSTVLNFDVGGGSNSTIELDANFAWTAIADRSWITVTPVSGDSSQTLTITADANQAIGITRRGTITLMAEGVPSQTIHVSQESTPIIIIVTPGSLSTALTSEGKLSITNLTLTGSIDARDFKTIHDQMPMLEELDITEATIEAFTDNTYAYTFLYPANTIPTAHGWNADDYTKYALTGHPKLAHIKLPVSLTDIGYRAFNECSRLTSIELQSSLTDIGDFAFYHCPALASINLPPSVTFIGEEAFGSCVSMKSIYCLAVNPPALNSFGAGHEVFEYVDKTGCILYVPFGKKELYMKAKEWGDFMNIVEMPGFSLSANNVNLEAEQGSASTINIISDIQWTASSDQAWLTVSPLNGTGNQTLTFTGDANTGDTARSALVTVLGPGIAPQTIEVTQLTGYTKVAEMEQNRPSFNCYPNPFTQQVSIEIQNPKHIKINLDIYNMAGKRIKSLAYGNIAEQLSLNWDGTNDRGQKVPSGVYIFKMNGLKRQVVKGR